MNTQMQPARTPYKFNYIKDLITPEYRKRVMEELDPWANRLFTQQAGETFRRWGRNTPISDALNMRIAVGECLSPLIYEHDLLFLEENVEPRDGDMVEFLWNEAARPGQIGMLGSQYGVKFLKFVDGHPWMVCNSVFCPFTEGDKITGVVRALRSPTDINFERCTATWIEGNGPRSGPIRAYAGSQQRTNATSGCGVLVSTNAHSVICRNNHVGAVNGVGNAAYQAIGTSGTLNGNDIQSPSGINTQIGPWNNDGTGNATGTQLADKTSNINTYGKQFVRRCFNTSNSRLMIATGPANTDPWAYSDGNTPGSITPT